jgi:hypothetical protein
MSKAWEYTKTGWSWVAAAWNVYEGVIHDYPRVVAIVLALYVAWRLFK